MGEIRDCQPVLLILAAFSRHEAALAWSLERASEAWGHIRHASPLFAFTETGYYTPTMGPGLIKRFVAFERLIDPGDLAAIKRATNAWEAEYAAAHDHAEPRPLNLDPGYITPAKVVLASTKDFAHRIYLDGGIYAEITLQFRHGAWHALPWTFPDYQRADYHEFFTACREYLVRRLQEHRSTPP